MNKSPTRTRRKVIDYWQIMAGMALGSLLFLLWSAPFWSIQSVDIRGTSSYTRKYLEDFLKAKSLVGLHILKLNPLTIKQQVLKNPLVRNVQFERELLPTRLTIKVQERKAAHLVYRQQGQFPLLDKHKAWILDHEGVVLPLPADAAPEQMVQVSMQPAKLKQKLPQTQLDLLRQLEALAQQKILPVEGVFDLSNPQNLILHLKEPAVRIWLGKAEELFIKLKLIEPVLQTAKQQNQAYSGIDYIDLRLWKHPVIKAR